MQWSLFAAVDPGRLQAVAKRRHYACRETLFHEGDPGDSVHLIVSGHVSVRVTTPGGDAVTLSLLGPGDSFGELALFTHQHRRTATVTALDTVETLVLTKPGLAVFRERYPQIDAALLGGLAARVQVLTEQLVEALYVPVEQRVVRRLLDLCRLYAAGAGTPPVVLPVTQDDLAGLAGATRPTVNQVLRKFADRGALVLHRGRIEVHDAAALVARAR